MVRWKFEEVIRRVNVKKMSDRVGWKVFELFECLEHKSGESIWRRLLVYNGIPL